MLRACLHMLRRLVRCLAPLVSRQVSRQSRLGTLVFPGRYQNQCLTECAEIKTDESMLLGLTLRLLFWRPGFLQGQSQPALQVPCEGCQGHVGSVADR